MFTRPSEHRLRFGLFEVDLATQELWKDGRKRALPDQPFQLLALLLSRPGEVITRDEMQQALWPDGKFVAVDQALNTNIKRIRLALGDSADNPRFIETIPRKGYRFIAPVRDAVSSATIVPARQPGPRLQGKRRLAFAAGAICVVLVSGLTLLFLRKPRSHPQPTPIPLTSYPGAEVAPAFSPDGNHVAFAWNPSEVFGQGNFGIYVKLIGGGDPVRLTPSDSNDFSPAWSPDGRFIAFLRALSTRVTGVFVIPAIGGVASKVGQIAEFDIRNPYFSRDLSWSPDSRFLILSYKERRESPYSLFRLDLETGEARRIITPGPRTFGDMYGTVAPDGRVMVISRCVAENMCELFMVHISRDLVAADEPKPLTTDLNARSPSWMPDGQAIIFIAGPTHSPSLAKLMLPGPGTPSAQPESLPYSGDAMVYPAVSRQGRLAYAQASLDLDVWQLKLMSNGVAKRPATRLISSTRLDHEAAYSPDGRRIAFCSNRSGSLQLWVSNSDGSNSIQLTSFGAPFTTADPRWSPDGRYIAFTANPHTQPSIYVIRSEGGRPERLELGVLPDWPLSGWSRDSKWLYFSEISDGQSHFWKLSWPTGGHSPSRAALPLTTSGHSLAESLDGQYLFYLQGSGNGDNALWKVARDGGQPVRVLDSVMNNDFAIVRDGIYFVPYSRPFSIKFLSFSNGTITHVAGLAGEPGWGFSVSPLEDSILYSEVESMRSDLMLVENFQ